MTGGADRASAQEGRGEMWTSTWNVYRECSEMERWDILSVIY
jgi:hypothetical protein